MRMQNLPKVGGVYFEYNEKYSLIFIIVHNIVC